MCNMIECNMYAYMCVCVCVHVLNMIQLTRIPLHIGKQGFVYSGPACKILIILYYSATGRRPQCLPCPNPLPPVPPLRETNTLTNCRQVPAKEANKPDHGNGHFYSSGRGGREGGSMLRGDGKSSLYTLQLIELPN